MADFPAIPLWTDAYLADTRHLSTLEHGAYLLLLMEAWRRPTRSLPDDDVMLARLAGLSGDEWELIRDTVMAFWKRDGRSRTWSQKRLSLEATYVANKSRSQKGNAAKRWNKEKNRDAVAMPNRCQSDAPTPTPTPTLVSDTKVSSPDAVRQDDVVEAWNDLADKCGLPKVRGPLSVKRKTALKARIREHPYEHWEDALNAIERAKWMHGDNDRGWRADFDFLLQPGSFQKLIEGAYDRAN